MGSTIQNICEGDPVPHEAVDRSCRWPVLFLLLKAAGWLVISLAIGLISSIKMHSPGFWSNCEWVTFGRLRPAFFTALIYGFAIQGSLGVSLWMLARLGKTQLVAGGAAIIGCGILNLGVAVGVLQIMAGQSTGFAWMEMPRQAAALVGGGFFLVAVSAFATLRHREVKQLYISHWFLLTALFCFLWFLVQGYVMGVAFPMRGIMQVILNAWYTTGLQYLVLTPFALAIAYFLLPKLIGKPVYSTQAAGFGFWILVLFAGWSAVSRIPQGPVPRWMLAVGTSCKFMLFMVAACFAVNWFLTLRQVKKASSAEPAWAFLVSAVWAFLAGTVLEVFGATHSLLSRVAFTTYSLGVTHLILFGFVTMTIFAAAYYVVERVLDGEWKSRGLIKAHLSLTLLGVLLTVGAYLFGGLAVGPKLNSESGAFVDVARSFTPFLGTATLGYFLLLLGQVLFAWNLVATSLAATSEERAEFCSWCCGDSESAKKARASA